MMHASLSVVESIDVALVKYRRRVSVGDADGVAPSRVVEPRRACRRAAAWGGWARRGALRCAVGCALPEASAVRAARAPGAPPRTARGAGTGSRDRPRLTATVYLALSVFGAVADSDITVIYVCYILYDRLNSKAWGARYTSCLVYDYVRTDDSPVRVPAPGAVIRVPHDHVTNCVQTAREQRSVALYPHTLRGIYAVRTAQLYAHYMLSRLGPGASQSCAASDCRACPRSSSNRMSCAFNASFSACDFPLQGRAEEGRSGPAGSSAASMPSSSPRSFTSCA